MNSHNALTAGLEQGLTALLGSKGTASLLELVDAQQLLLTCLALVAFLRALDSLPVAGRVSGIMEQVLLTIALNVALQGVSQGFDIGMATLNLLSVYFLTGALDHDGVMSTTSQYLLVARLTATLRQQPDGVLPVAWALAFVPTAGWVPAEAAQLAQLVTLESFSAWLRAWFPPSLLLPSTAILLYLCAPFIEYFPALNRLYRFAVFAVSNDVNLVSVPVPLAAAALWALWQLEPEPVSKHLAALAGCNLAVLATLDALRFAIDDDPAPVLLALLTGIRILENSGAALSAGK
jgi:hypothetical protein